MRRSRTEGQLAGGLDAVNSQPQWFRSMLRNLREHVPPLLPVRVYVRDHVDGFGSASLKLRRGRPSHFVVEIRRADRQVMIDTLRHEWAHCLAWHDGPFCEGDHPDDWGIQYARCYRATTEP